MPYPQATDPKFNRQHLPGLAMALLNQIKLEVAHLSCTDTEKAHSERVTRIASLLAQFPCEERIKRENRELDLAEARKEAEAYRKGFEANKKEAAEHLGVVAEIKKKQAALRLERAKTRKKEAVQVKDLIQDQAAKHQPWTSDKPPLVTVPRKRAKRTTVSTTEQKISKRVKKNRKARDRYRAQKKATGSLPGERLVKQEKLL